MKPELRTVDLVTPEGVVLQFEIATLAERMFAFFLDLFIIMFSTSVIVIVGLLLTCMTGLGEPLAIALLGLFLIRYGYYAFFEIHWQGATPAKRFFKIKVVSRDGMGLTVDAVIARNLMRDVELFLPVLVLIAPQFMLGSAPWWMVFPAAGWAVVIGALPAITRERTRAGDLVGGTVVVRVGQAKLVADEAARASVPSGALPADTLTFTPEQLSVYGEHELETLAHLIRQADVGKANLRDLQIVAGTIAQKIDYRGPEPVHDPARFLRAFYKRQRTVLEKQLLFGKRKASKHDQ